MTKCFLMCQLVSLVISAGVIQAAPWNLVGPAVGGKAGEVKTLAPNGSAAALPPVCKMLFCPGGEFPVGLANVQTKTLGSFWIGETEVTYGLWLAVCQWSATNGYHFQNAGVTPGTAQHPVSSVSWRDAVVWCNALSEMTGLHPVYQSVTGEIIKDSRDANGTVCDQALNHPGNGFRLPTQWEWECAARWQGDKNDGGARRVGSLYWSNGTYPAGGTSGGINALNSAVPNRKGTAAVKSKPPNMLGCYDLTGNVAEWCFGTTSANALVRNLRGGAWYQNYHYLRIACGLAFFPNSAGTGTGFRLALSGTSQGNDYVVSGGAVTNPVPAPAREIRNARVSTKILYQNQSDACLENPDGFPICRRGIGFIQLNNVREEIYDQADPALVADMDRKNQLLDDLFQSGAQVFETFASGVKNPGMSEQFVAGRIQIMKAAEAAGRTVYGFWTFREDAFLFPHRDKNGNFDPAYYGKHLPPFPKVDPRILSLEDIKNFRTQIAASDLSCRTNCKMIQLLLQGTMLKLLHPELMPNAKGNTNALTLAERNAVLEYLCTNFDGVGEEVHIGFHTAPPNSFGGLAPVSQAAYAKWCLDNGKVAFMFLGGGQTTFEKKGLGFAKQSYELLFKDLQAQGVAPNSTNLIWFRQGGFQAIAQGPEEIHNDASPTVFSEVAWLDKRLNGPVIMNRPTLPITAGQPWRHQPEAATLGTSPLSWSLSNAPAGMTIDAKTGLIQWTPASPSTTSGKVTLTVTDGTESDAETFETGTTLAPNNTPKRRQ